MAIGRQIEDRMVLGAMVAGGDLVLDTTTRKLQAYLGEGITTTNPTFIASYFDSDGSTLTSYTVTGSLNGITPVDIVAAPADAGTVRFVTAVTIYNADSVTHNIIVRLNDNGSPFIYGNFPVTTGKSLFYADGVWQVGEVGNGSVVSVALSAPAEFVVSGSPVTTFGTLALTWATEAANKIFAGPTSGAAATPGFRSLVAADLTGLFNGFANPTASIGLTAVNGSALTAMRSDGAPPLDQGIVPTWTGAHTWSAAGVFNNILALNGVTTATAQINGTNLTLTGWERIGSVSTPNNTTAGDFTCARMSIGDVAMAGATVLDLETTDTGTSGTRIQALFTPTFSPASASSISARTVQIGLRPSGAQNFTGTLYSIFLDPRIRQSGDIANLIGIFAPGVTMDTSSVNFGTITTCAAIEVIPFNRIGSIAALTGTVSSLYGIMVDASATSTSVTFTGSAGIAIAAQIRGTNNANLLLGTQTIPTGNFNIYGTSSRGSTFEIADAITNTISDIWNWQHQTSGTAAANFGVANTWSLENASGNVVIAGRAGYRWLTATNAAEDSEYVISTIQGGTLAEKVRVTPRGYVVSPGNTRVTADFNKTNTTLADVTGLTVNVAAGKTYHFEAWLPYAADITSGHKYAIAGTATATDFRAHITSVADATNLNVITATVTALAASAGQAGSTAGDTRISGTITVNAAGTLTVQFALNAGTTTGTIKRGATFIVTEID